MHSIILCGGSGTRLWPLSRKNFPKQFLNLYSDKSLLQETFLRARKIMPAKNIVFVTNKKNYFNAVNQIKEIEKDFNPESSGQILQEPASLNTLPAIMYAVKYLVDIKNIDLTEPVIILPADHYIGNEEIYLNLLKSATENIGNNIGTIGIKPIKPETGYGYIKKGAPVVSTSPSPLLRKEGEIHKVEKFAEKPDKKTAEGYLKSGEYLWNSGMYIFKIISFLNELRNHQPKFFSFFQEHPEIFVKNFSGLPSISIDAGISEKSDKMIVFVGEFGWSDIGSFDSLAEIIGEKNNQAKHISFDSKNIFVHSAGNRLIATSGVEDLIIIENNDSILIQKRGKSEDIKKIVEHLNAHNYKESEHNIIVHRPWGKYEVLTEEPGVKVKKITVYPGAQLSLQSHLHRAEHWVVIRGLAKIINGEKEIYLKENESSFIPAMNKHRLKNPGKTNLEIIEVQTGNYTKEDDIIRYDDIYKRGRNG